jgi:hypothetical protein
MGKRARWEYFKVMYSRYHKSPRKEKKQILDEFCQVCDYHCKKCSPTAQ